MSLFVICPPATRPRKQKQKKKRGRRSPLVTGNGNFRLELVLCKLRKEEFRLPPSGDVHVGTRHPTWLNPRSTLSLAAIGAGSRKWAYACKEIGVPSEATLFGGRFPSAGRFPLPPSVGFFWGFPGCRSGVFLWGLSLHRRRRSCFKGGLNISSNNAR